MRCCSSAYGPTSRTRRRCRDRTRGEQHDSQRAGAVLVVPHHGRPRLLVHRAVRTAFWLSALCKLDRYRWFLWIALLSLPLPWIAAELGWIVAEYGRQPWVIEGVLPTFLGVSSTGGRQCCVQPARLRAVLFVAARSSISICSSNISGLGPEAALGRPIAGPRQRVTEDVRLRNLAPYLVGAARHPAHRLRRHGRLRSRHRGAAALRRADRHRAPHRHQHGRPGLGRQSGLVHPWRRGDLRGLAGALCRELFRLLSGDVPGAARRSSCGRSGSSSAARSKAPRWRGILGLGAVRGRRGAVAGVRRRVRQSVQGRAVHLRSAICAFIRPSRCFRCSIRSRCLSGWSAWR